MDVPKHLGIILDGNRRFAKRLMLEPWKGHEYGAEKVRKVLDWCREYGIKKVTLYSFSIKNFNRPKIEFDFLMDLFKKEFESLENDKDLIENGIKVRFIGRINMFPKDVYDVMQRVMEKTINNSKFEVNFAMAYGGREELVDAITKISEKINAGEIRPDQISEDLISQNLGLKDNIDLVIRTSGEHRTSGFFIWQSDYAEYAFVDKFWPEFEKEDFVKILQNYSERERRFGK